MPTSKSSTIRKVAADRSPVEPDSIKNPAVDEYIATSPEFAQPILNYIRDLLHQAAPEAIEEMKWSRPFFVQNGVILANLAAFQRHCSFGLWGFESKTSLASQSESGGMGTFGKIKRVEDLPSRVQLLELIREAAARIRTGERTTNWSRPRIPRPEAVVPEELEVRLSSQPSAAKAFAAMTPSCRREYCEWIAEGKRVETRMQRAETAISWIIEGKSRHWKYSTRG